MSDINSPHPPPPEGGDLLPTNPDAPLPSVWGLAGLPEPELRPDDQAPPVDHRLVADLAAERLRDDPDLADYVWDLVRHFRPWRDAYARVLGERDGASDARQNDGKGG